MNVNIKRRKPIFFSDRSRRYDSLPSAPVTHWINMVVYWFGHVVTWACKCVPHAKPWEQEWGYIALAPQISDVCAAPCICPVWSVNLFPACPLWWLCVYPVNSPLFFFSFWAFDLSPVFVVINITGMNILFKLFFPSRLFAWGVFPRVGLQSQRLVTIISLVLYF